MKSRRPSDRLTLTAALLAIAVVLTATSAAAASASRYYEHGAYEDAYQRYRDVAQDDQDNWPLLYNLGAAAYKAGKIEEAAQAFERATGTPDRQLQARSFYNLGNSLYRVGEGLETDSPTEALPSYQQSLRHFENALAIEPNDEDAQFNRDVVKKKIEELEKQQQQQQQQQKQNDSKDKQDQKKDQPQPSAGEEEKQDQQAAAEEDGDEPQASPERQEPASTLDRIQARALLDNLREKEQIWNYYPELDNAKQQPDSLKDW